MSRNICLLVLLASLSLAVPASADRPDVAIMLHAADDDSAWLIIVADSQGGAYKFTKSNRLWEKEQDIPLAEMLGVQNSPSGLARTLKLSSTPDTWPQFWDVLINSLQGLSDQSISYAKATGSPDDTGIVRLLVIAQPSEESASIPIQRQGSPALSWWRYANPNNPPTPTIFKIFAPYWLGFMVILALLVYLFRHKVIALLRKHLLQMAHRVGRAPAGQTSLDELLICLYKKVQGPERQSMPEVDTSLRSAAIEYVSREYRRAAAGLPPIWITPAGVTSAVDGADGTDAQGEQDGVKRSEQARGKNGKMKEALAHLGGFTLELCRKRGKISDPERAQTFLEAEFKKLDGLADHTERLTAVSEQNARLLEERNKFAETAKHLEAEKKQITKEAAGFSGQMSRQQEKLEETEKRLRETEASLRNLRAAHDEIRVQGDSQLATEQERSRTALQQKEEEFRSVRTGLETAREQALKRTRELEGELVTVRDEKIKAETLVRTLETSLESEKGLNVNVKRRQKALEEKLNRVLQANTFLGKVHKAYWDRCKHPLSMGAILYQSYLGLFQTALGAGREDPELEATGWSNLMNLLRRVAQVPGLDHFQKEFGPRVYPEIDSIQLQRTVENNRPDSERFVHSSVLQTLLSGEVQIDGDQRARFSLERLRGWPLYFRVDQAGIWGAM